MIDIIKKYDIKKYTINNDKVDAYVVDLAENDLTKIPIKFGYVDYFDCSINNLTTLENSPSVVKNNFYCHGNNLTTLEHCPKYIGGNFLGYFNYLKDNEIHYILGNVLKYIELDNSRIVI